MRYRYCLVTFRTLNLGYNQLSGYIPVQYSSLTQFL